MPNKQPGSVSFYDELKRRNVIRVGIAYIVAAWLIIQVTETIFPLFGYGDIPARIVVIMLAIGFPLFLLFSWVFEFTPEGLKRETDVDLSATATRESGKQLDRIIIVLLALGLGYFAFDKFVLNPARDAELVKETAHQARSEALVESYGNQSIAVLPFVNMSDDADNEYFSDGISEEILNLLTKIPDLRVISRSSSFSFKGKEITIPEIAKSLNVAHILEGSIRKSGSQVRITAQLIEAGTDTHLWSETYTRDVLDVFAVQDEIAGKIGKQLELTLVSTGPPVRPTESEEAYDHYLRGLYFHDKRDFLKARDHFQAAVDLDPAYAHAQAWLSFSLIALGNHRVLPPLEVFPLAQKAAMAAIELDENLYLAHLGLGWVALSGQRDWVTAEKEFRRAVELAPGAFWPHYALAWPLQITGRYEDAIASVLKSIDISPLELWPRGNLTDLYYKTRDFDAAEEMLTYLNETLPEPDDADGEADGLAWQGMFYADKQEPQKALDYVTRAAGLMTGEDPNVELLVAQVFAMLGEQSEARNILQQIDLEDDTRYVSPCLLAAVYANLGENDLAMESLYRGVEQYDSLIWNLDYPVYDPIRSDPRFIKLCEDLKMACAEIPALGENR